MDGTGQRSRLVVRVDDAGLSEGVNRAVVEALRGPAARSVSLMVPGPAAAHAAALLAPLPGVVHGLHVTLTSEWERPRWRPVLPARAVPSLLDRDGFLPRTADELHARGGVDPREAAAEITAQLDRAREWGLAVRYLDEHMGVGWVAGAGEAVRAVAAAQGLIDADRLVPALPVPPGGDLRAALRRASPGPHVLITHPGPDDDTLRALRGTGFPDGGVGTVRDADRRLLADRALWSAVRADGTEPTDYAALFRP
ncbi:ChbG/HpnK family deacetylase [Kitasatospora fiedleri]|uniref:ChbG/HpnK family deacetylase n=1 Tax=Kitasatospora fiedleri TaxID=2991545 RepID=UPI00249A426E|nr:ChbG/HpnK family deacetylase [Kitasatospora fiedleri]